MRRLPPALAAAATPRILELLGEEPGRVLGWKVVVEADPARAEQARQGGADLAGIDAARIVLVDERGVASMSP
jgi:hypothetical protein